MFPDSSSRAEGFREEAGVVAGWAARPRSPVHDSRRSSPGLAACSGSASQHVKRASQRFRHASKRRWQRFAEPFVIVSQCAGAQRVWERFRSAVRDCFPIRQRAACPAAVHGSLSASHASFPACLQAPHASFHAPPFFPDSSLSRRVSEKKPAWWLVGPDAHARRSTTGRRR